MTDTSMAESIGRQFAIAFIAYQGDVSFATAKKRYGDQPIGAYWIALAEQVIADHKTGTLSPRGR